MLSSIQLIYQYIIIVIIILLFHPVYTHLARNYKLNSKEIT